MSLASSPRAEIVVRWVSVAALVAGLVLLGRGLPVGRVASWLEASVGGAGPWGPLLFGAVYVVAALLLLPGSVLTIGAGALFGPLVGTVVVSLASTSAATLAFLIGRYLARDAVARAARARPAFGAIDRAVAEGGWKVVALLRLSPAVPFSAGNYLFGLTPVGLVPYVLASWVAMLPGTFLYVYLGHVGQAAARGGGRTVGQWALLATGLAATLVVTVYLTRLARRALREPTAVEGGPGPVVAAAPGPRRPWRLGRLALSGALVLTAGLLVACGVLRFGPPEVTLREAYGDAPGSATFDHSALDALLTRHVDPQGLVDYAGLGEDQAALGGYLDQLARVDLDSLGRDERLALLINAYNAFTLRLILGHYPLDSIRDIPSDQRWDGRTWTLGGRPLTLTQLENDELRPKFSEPRVHFALNCASLGCPPLRREAYVGARLDAQLEDQARQVHADPRWFRYDPGSSAVSLTRLYDWYGGDFAQVAGSPLEFAARYSAPLREELVAGRRPEVLWLEYDWSLNARSR